MSASAPIVTPVSNSQACSLLTWKDPVQTGKVFGGILAALIVFKFVNLINVFFHLSYLGLLVAAAAEYSGKLVTGQGFVTKYKPSTKSYAAVFNKDLLPAVADFNIKFEAEVQKIIYAHDIETTLKAAGISYIIFKLTSWFSLYTLLVSSVVLTFTAPAAYFHNKKEVDAAVHKYTQCAKAKIDEYTKLAHKSAAPHIETLIKKTGPVGSFISSKIPTRTAGSTVGASPSSYAHTNVATTKVAAPAEPAAVKIPEVSTATTTGASKFPEVPATLVDEVKAAAKTTGEVPAPTI